MSSTEDHLRQATVAFDHLFANELDKARDTFATGSSPFHALGSGVCAFLEAALGMEPGLMAEASRQLSLSEAGAKRELKAAKTQASQFPPGTEWELLHSDAVILLGMTHALSESYMGYVQCLAHSKFSKLFKTVYPNGLDEYATPAASAPGSRAASIHSVSSALPSPKPQRSSFFSRLTGASLTVPSTPQVPIIAAEGSIDELILSGTAFGYGLFNLVFSLLPAKVRGVVGFFGFEHDRKLALRALAVSAAKTDVHSVFAGLSLMTYHGVVLLLLGYQADEEHILRQYGAIVEKLEARYPTGSLWILNRAKILRMSYDPEGAIKVLQGGLDPGKAHTFEQADALLIFELAWTLLSQRRYQEAADAFIRMTEVNSWSHATYYFLAAGCYISMKNYDKAQELLDKNPDLLEKKKIGGKDLPTEVFIKKKLTFLQEKQKSLTGSEDNFARAATISPAEELAIFWNTHCRITKDAALAHIQDWSTALQTPITVTSQFLPPPSKDAIASSPNNDTPDELGIRAVLMGIVHRTAGDFAASRAFLEQAITFQPQIKTSTWVGGVACFELATLDLKEQHTRETEGAGQVDLSSRLDSRVAMLKDEIALKKEMLGIVA
ncbi:outer membrane protein Iml2/Tetratricopeptide repeat protein 39 [Epithele typhae]|uniref:outer membrane protein Iml2/Tetratricopeptide repeat protein 39 n=1 Tax=Epithele typhae TaxID=378194 RepID=UPI002007535A|nr:outer membrane protein Iml2/Tetratricopeptide repeat protein 39 [Epithele typhae]KAH9945781.1 outer membrane protein Iml2/Tetratricopeptide repeat protein 39 [Epithele typhae]